MMLVELQKLYGADAAMPEDPGEPPVRRPHKEHPCTSLDSMFDEIADEQASASLCCAPVTAATQLEIYLAENPISREDSPLQYWTVNKLRFPTLAQLSQKYLSAPCSNVDSERLFGSVSHIVDDKRNRLTAEHAEKLLFLKKNLPIVFP